MNWKELWRDGGSSVRRFLWLCVRCKSKDNVKIDLKEIGWEGVDWICLAQDSSQWWALVNTVMNLQLPYNMGISRVVKQLLASQERPSSMELVMVLC
jgi:hypothetical protein